MDWVRRGNDLRCRRAGWPPDASSHRQGTCGIGLLIDHPRGVMRPTLSCSPSLPTRRADAANLCRCDRWQRPRGKPRSIGGADRGACFRPIARTGLPCFVGRRSGAARNSERRRSDPPLPAQPDGRSILRCHDETVPAPARAGRSASCPTSRRSRIPGCPRRDRAGPVREAGKKRISSMTAFRRGAWAGSRIAAAGPARATGRG